MARMVFSEVAGTLSFLQPQCDDDMTDRLHYYYSPSALLVTAVLISLKMFGGSPVECWLPAEFQTSWQEYTELMCWSQNTYFVKFENDFPRDEKAREQTMISYYQWTPFFLVLSAFFFYSPCLIWRMFYSKSGIVLKEVVAFATDPSNIQQRVRDANLRGISAHLSAAFRHRFRWTRDTKEAGVTPEYFKYNRLRVQHNDSLMTRLFNLRFYEAYLTSLYIVVKLLFLANVMAQAYLMNRFLQTDYYDYYGWGVFKDLLQGNAWNDSGNFPRITYCDLDVRILGTVQKHTVQCVLVINIFTEKIFVMLWIWYTLLMAISIFSLLNWIFRMVPVEARRDFIARRLEMADVDFRRENFHAELDEFVRDYIKIDGVFVLRMLTIHAGMLVCTQIVDNLWEEFKIFSVEAAAKRIEEEIIEPAPSSAVANDKDRPQLGRRKTPVLAPLTTQHDHYYHGGYGNDSKSFPHVSSLMASRMDLRRPSMSPSIQQSKTGPASSGRQAGATSGFPQRFTAAAAGVTSNQRTGFRRFSTPATGHSMPRHGPTPIHKAATLAMTMSQFDVSRESMGPTNMPLIPPIRVEPSEEFEEEEVTLSGQRRDQYLRVPSHSDNAENEED